MPVSIPKYLKSLIKILISIGVFAYVFYLVNEQWEELVELFDHLWVQENSISLALLFILIWVNWGIESLKWKVLVSKLEKVSFLKAYYGVLLGLSLSIVTPRSIGDYVGRLVPLEKKDKTRMLGGLLLSRVFQMFATLLFGAISCYYYLDNFTKELPFSYLVPVLIFIILFGLLVIRKWLLSSLFETLLGKKVKKFIAIIMDYTVQELFFVAALSVVRYSVFSFQYFLILRLLGVDLGALDLYVLIAVVFLVKSMAISINFVADMGVRQVTAVSIMATVHIGEMQSMIASFGLWGFNILLPASLGATCWLFLKLK